MPDSLSTEQIRRLIFKIKWGGGMFSDLARWIGDEAFKEGLLQQRPDFAYAHIKLSVRTFLRSYGV